ncbi:TPA: hypothetical protein EYO57_00475 [Candidatus Poribacteria bacterium]|nr:hypothetical protein [Candidatus Poribacteria bacterium]
MTWIGLVKRKMDRVQTLLGKKRKFSKLFWEQKERLECQIGRHIKDPETGDLVFQVDNDHPDMVLLREEHKDVMDEIDADLKDAGWTPDYPVPGKRRYGRHGRRRAFRARFPGRCGRVADSGRQFFHRDCDGCGQPFSPGDLIQEKKWHKK